MKNDLVNPNGTLTKEETSRVHAHIPKPIFTALFLKCFPRHGAQQRIAAQLLCKFYAECKKRNMPHYWDKQNELRAQEILDALTFTYDTPNGPDYNPDNTGSKSHGS